MLFQRFYFLTQRPRLQPDAARLPFVEAELFIAARGCQSKISLLGWYGGSLGSYVRESLARIEKHSESLAGRLGRAGVVLWITEEERGVRSSRCRVGIGSMERVKCVMKTG